MKVLRPVAFTAVAIATALVLSACGSDSEKAMEETTEQTSVGTIVDVASGAGNFSTLVAAVTAAAPSPIQIRALALSSREKTLARCLSSALLQQATVRRRAPPL